MRNRDTNFSSNFDFRLAVNLPDHAATIQDESLTIHEILKSGVILCEYVGGQRPPSNVFGVNPPFYEFC